MAGLWNCLSGSLMTPILSWYKAKQELSYWRNQWHFLLNLYHMWNKSFTKKTTLQ